MIKNLPLVFGSFSGRQLAVVSFLFSVFILSVVGILWQINQYFLVEVPKIGGTLVEGMVGSPRFINPVLAISDTDRDLSALVYSGLMQINNQNKLEPVLAQSYTLSENHLTYTFTLREDLSWHDGEPLSADDIEFTIEQIKNPVIKSPRLPNWEGVEVEKIDSRTIKFNLRQPYAAFLENLTLGILPKHLWQEVSAENFPFSPLNIEPVGSGPYQIKKIQEDSNKIKESYEFKPFHNFALGSPKIKHLVMRFYPNGESLEEARLSGKVEALAAINPGLAASSKLDNKENQLLNTPLPRVFGVFLNQNQAPVFIKKEVRQALNLSVDREKIITEVFHGFGKELNSPLPGENFAVSTKSSSSPTSILEKAGWKFSTTSKQWTKKEGKAEIALQFTLATANTTELKQVAEIIKSSWENLGAVVELKIFEAGDLNEKVIRPREYEALLFGEIMGREPDAFPFWHSSQRLDPGLNIALYTNTKADKLLEEARATIDPEERNKKHTDFVKLVNDDQAAIFLYSPDFLYLLPKKVRGASLPIINTASERFANITEWYIETEKVWPIFSSKNN